MGPRQCQVCDSAQSKYKCPTCFLPYCSLMCFKQHKEIPCSREVVPEPEDLQFTQPRRSFEDDDEHGWRLQQSQLEAIASSSEIRNLVKDEELQKVILKIDSSANAEEAPDLVSASNLIKPWKGLFLGTSQTRLYRFSTQKSNHL